MTLPDTQLLNFPSGSVPINSPFYVERPPIEQLVASELEKPGSVIRIKAPRKTGKSSLLNRIVAHGKSLDYSLVRLDFHQADQKILSSIDRFLRWFCANVSLQLDIPPQLDEFWDEDIGSKVSATVYFQAYLLEATEHPIILVLNDIHHLFEYAEISKEFLPLLRSWHEEGKQSPLWQKLRLVVIHSTEIYIPLNIHQSPFNVGLPITLPPFTLPQVQDLTLRHGLTFAEGEEGLNLLRPLYEFIGGHPYLVRLALYHLCAKNLTLEELLENAATMSGIYRDHLRNQLAILKDAPELESALKQVLESSEPLSLEALVAYQLESMGLVILEGNKVQLSCQLYRQYFSEQLLQQKAHPKHSSRSWEENFNTLDTLTKVANRQYCEKILDEKWEVLKQSAAPLSVALVDIDYFRVFNDAYGHLVGDDCLREIAQVLSDCSQSVSGVVGRYESDQFMIVLPEMDTTLATQVAEMVRDGVKIMGLAHDESRIGGLPESVLTVSVGIACVLPTDENIPSELVNQAGEALYLAKRQGRNCVVVSSKFNYQEVD